MINIIDAASLPEEEQLLELSTLHRQCFRRGWDKKSIAEVLNSGQCLSFLLQINNSSLGFLIARIAGDEAEILSFGIHPSYQGQGYGQALLDYTVRVIKNHRVRTIFLEVENTNAAAVKIYEALGFRSLGRRKAYFPMEKANPADALILALNCDTNATGGNPLE